MSLAQKRSPGKTAAGKSGSARAFGKAASSDRPPRWDLGFLYPGLKSKTLKEDMEWVEDQAKSFAEEYDGYIYSLDGNALGEAVEWYENILETRDFIEAYAVLLEAQNTDNHAKTGFLREWLAKISATIGFFEAEISQMSETSLLSKMSASRFSQYAGWVAGLRHGRDHMLDEKLSDFVDDGNDVHSDLWERLYHETISALVIDVQGKRFDTETVTEEIYSKDKAEALAARSAAGAALKEAAPRAAFILNVQAKDKEIYDRHCNYATPWSSVNESNHLSDTTVETMFNTIKQSYAELSHRFHTWKARQLGKETLDVIDRSFDVTGASSPQYSWNEAIELVLEAFRKFSPRFARLAKSFIENDFIDAQPRKNKEPGAFCYQTGPGGHPFVHVNFTGDLDSVFDLAHELGHGVHFMLAEQKQGLLQSSIPTVVSETASIFAEMLLFRQIMDSTQDIALRRHLLEKRIDDKLKTSLLQIAYFDFERQVHSERRQGELSADRITQIWEGVMREYYGPQSEIDDFDRHYWMLVGHFYTAPFYVYSYAFGECLVNALYEEYRKDPASGTFQESYLDFLEAGSSKQVMDLLSDFGFDPEDPQYWRQGLKLMENYLDVLEGLDDPGKDIAPEQVVASGSGVGAPPQKPPQPGIRLTGAKTPSAKPQFPKPPAR